MLSEFQKTLNEKFAKIEAILKEEFVSLRTGRANASLVENIQVTYYGSVSPLKQMAQIATPDSSQISIQPWDKSSLADIELAIRNSGLNLSPVNDGNAIRIILPPMTEERRKELTKLVHAKTEEAKIAARNVRGEIWESVQNKEKTGELTQDDRDRSREELDKQIAIFNEKLVLLSKEKEEEITKV